MAHFNLKKANRFLPYILLVGLGIGTANFMMNSSLNWIQMVIQSLSTSFIIGYTTVAIGSNKSWFKLHFKPKWKLYLIVFSGFLMAALLATELEHIIRALIFGSEAYMPFSAGKMYMYNSIIALFLGFSIFQNNYFVLSQDSNLADDQNYSENQTEDEQSILKSGDLTTSIPVKQGETILLIPTKDIVYFEAYDNYAFVYDLTGKKRLCDYSLRFLQTRLDEAFSRVHRKYIVNQSYITQIKPHLNSRYVIEFSPKAIAPITSSKSYSKAIRKLIKIE